MRPSDAYSFYRQQDIVTSNPREIVSKLYSGAIVNLKRAVLDIQAKQVESAHRHIVQAKKILAVLDSSLDFNYEISGQLHQLYDYMLRRLHQANIKKDIDILNEVSGMLVEIRDAWDEARKIANQ